MEELTEKEKIIRVIILNRLDTITGNILPCIKSKGVVEYLNGKIEGLKEVYELMGVSLDDLKKTI